MTGHVADIVGAFACAMAVVSTFDAGFIRKLVRSGRSTGCINASVTYEVAVLSFTAIDIIETLDTITFEGEGSRSGAGILTNVPIAAICNGRDAQADLDVIDFLAGGIGRTTIAARRCAIATIDVALESVVTVPVLLTHSAFGLTNFAFPGFLVADLAFGATVVQTSRVTIEGHGNTLLGFICKLIAHPTGTTVIMACALAETELSSPERMALIAIAIGVVCASLADICGAWFADIRSLHILRLGGAVPFDHI
jgi:hypothetical protein